MSLPSLIVRLGTRGSLLARTQSQLVADDLEKRHPGLQVELIIIKTSGDVITDKPLHDAGGKGLFVKELELALLAAEVDLAVHSYKDVPVIDPRAPSVSDGSSRPVDGSSPLLHGSSHLIISATPPREDPRDVLVSRIHDGQAPPSLHDLPPGATIGTGSLRRGCQILHRRPDLVVQPIRGNIDTRLRKLQEGQHDAIVLAMAGVRRAGLFDAACMQILELDVMLPAPGQGALALQCRRNDDRTRNLLTALHDADVELCVTAERQLVAKLGGDCHSPIAALATLDGDTLRLRAAVGARDGGTPVIFANASGPRTHPHTVVENCFAALDDQNVESLLRPGR